MILLAWDSSAWLPGRRGRAARYRTSRREEQFNTFIRDPSNRFDLDGDGIDESLRFNFPTAIHTLNPFFLTSVYNDRIETVKMRVRGDQLGLGEVAVRLTWGDANCSETQCSSAFIRTEDAFKNGGSDDLRVYNLPSKTTVLVAPTGGAAFPDEAGSNALAMRNVANASRTLIIDMRQGPNQGFNLDGIDEIELVIEHQAYALQLSALSPQRFEPQPIRAYQPAIRQLDLQELYRDYEAHPERLSLLTDTAPVTGAYAGIAVADFPHYMPDINLSLVLTEAESSISGYLLADLGLSYPVVDPDNQQGPLLTGGWDGDHFNLLSEPFTTTMPSELIFTRQVSLTNVTVIITGTGQTLTGQYQERLTGISQLPLTISGSFTVTRPLNRLAPTAAFNALPASGPPPLNVQFNDMSGNGPTSWEWEFGDETTSTEQHPSHIYNDEGTYTVKLTATNEFGQHTLEKVGYIEVEYNQLYLPMLAVKP